MARNHTDVFSCSSEDQRSKNQCHWAKVKVSSGLFFSGGFEGRIYFLAFFQLLEVACVPCHFLASLCPVLLMSHLLLLSCHWVSLYLSLMRTLWLHWVHLNNPQNFTCYKILRLVTSAKSPLPYKVTLTGIRTWVSWGTIIQPTTFINSSILVMVNLRHLIGISIEGLGRQLDIWVWSLGRTLAWWWRSSV